MSKTKTMMVTFKACTLEVKPLQSWINETIMAVEGQITVDKLFENNFAQVLAIGSNAVSGKTLESYDDAAKAIGTEIDKLKKAVFEELAIRSKDIETKFTGPEKAERLERIGQIKARTDNSLKSAKSVVTNAVKNGDAILRVVKDGGHILWRADGTPRGKTQLQDMIKAAKSAAHAPKSDIEKAMDASLTFARRLAVLDGKQRTDVLRKFSEKLTDLVAEEWGEEDESDDTNAPVAEAA